MLQLRGNPSKTADAIASLSYVGSILLALYSIITTAIFSYLVWKVSIGSFQVSKELKNLEENRDKEVVREQALIVYYDLQRGFSYLRDLYISTVKKGIYLLTFPENQVIKRKTGMTSFDVMINNVRFYFCSRGELWDGDGIFYTVNGYEKADGHFTEGLFRTGKVYGYFDNVSKHYLIKYETTGLDRTILEGELVDSSGTEQECYYF